MKSGLPILGLAEARCSRPMIASALLPTLSSASTMAESGMTDAGSGLRFASTPVRRKRGPGTGVTVTVTKQVEVAVGTVTVLVDATVLVVDVVASTYTSVVGTRVVVASAVFITYVGVDFGRITSKV